MMLTTARIRQIGWSVILGLCIAAFAVLSLKVHGVRSLVLQAETRLAQLEKKKQRLETEFQARASQHRLAQWNHVDMGYVAPRADQYLEGGKQLAELGLPTSLETPTPIRVARVDPGAETVSPDRKMVSPISGAEVTLASVNVPESASGVLGTAIGSLLIEAAPIREAKASSGSTYIAEATE